MMRTILGLLLLAGFAPAQDPVPAADTKAPKAAFTQKAIYPLATCMVSGEELDAEAVTFEAGGRTFKVCCEKCQAKIEKDPAKFTGKLDAAIATEQAKTYPLTVCPISGKKLGSMGDPVNVVVDGTLVQLCCDGCTKKAQAKGPELAAKVREAAFAKQSKSYPVTECIVSGEKLGDDAVSVMYGTRLVKLCCEKCSGAIEKDPAKYLSKLEPKAAKDAAPAAAPGEKPKGEAKGSGKDGKDGECCAGEGDGGCGACPPEASGASGASGPAGNAGKPKDGKDAKAGGCCSEGAKAGEAKAGEAKAGCCGDKAGEKAKDAKPAGECCGDKPAPKTEPKIN